MKGRFRMLGEQGFATYEVDVSKGVFERTLVDGEADRLLTPGLVDIHIHGAFGIDFMSASRDQLTGLADRLAEVGYEAFLPTTVSASSAGVAQALDQLPDDPRILGFHLEGPFLSPKFPGAQPPEAIVDFASADSGWQTILGDRRMRVATMAPERPGGRELAARLASQGVLVSMGHTDATFDEARSGFEAGFRHATHTFNAMRGLHHREAGALGFAFLEDGMSCELIYDRLHVSKEAASLLFRCKPKDKVIAISDGTMASGLSPGERFSMWNHDVETRSGGVYLAGTDTLAGSAITLLDAFKNLAEDFGPETAIRACCLNPRLALGWSQDPEVWLEWTAEGELAEIHRMRR